MSQRRPNIVFILTDDHRYDAMSFMDHPFAKTPHMDTMAKNGAHLKNAFVTTFKREFGFLVSDKNAKIIVPTFIT